MSSGEEVNKDTSMDSIESFSSTEEDTKVNGEEKKETGELKEETGELKEETGELKEETEELKEETEEVKEETEEVKEIEEVKEESEETYEEVEPGLLEQPVEQTGKRDRKKIERFEYEAKKEELEGVEGQGTSLGEIPYIEMMITKSRTDELKMLHRISYSRPGAASDVKKNLRKFNGFAFKKEDKAYERKQIVMEKINSPELKKILKLLGLERNGLKKDLVERIMEFMMCPEDKGKKTPVTKKRKSLKNKKKVDKSTPKSKPVSKPELSAGESENSESSDDEAQAKEAVEEQKPTKKTPAKKEKKTPAVKRKKPEPNEDTDSEDEPIAKVLKTIPPSDYDIRTFVKSILDEANLEEVTMKKVCQKVYDKYPQHDLTHKKDFIKATVKKILS